MTVIVNVDIRQLSGVGTDEPVDNALLEISPYSRETVDDYVLSKNKLIVHLVDGVGSFTLPGPTEAGQGLKIRERGFRGGATRIVGVPDVAEIDYTDLPDLDPSTLDPTVPLTPAWQVYIDDAVAALVAGAPGALDTLNELAAALGDDANFAATVAASLALKADDADLATEIADRTSAVSAEAALARNADNLTSGTVPDARIPASIARDAEVTAAVSAEASTRASADTTNANAIAAEVSRATTAEGVNATAISNETSRATSAENLLNVAVAAIPAAVKLTGDKRYLHAPGPAIIGTIGASITNNGTLSYYNPATSGCISYGSLSPFSYGLAKTKGRFVAGGTASTVGFTTQQMIDTHLPTVLASNWDYCIIGEVTNDLGNGVAIATTRTNVTTIITSLLNVGIMPILTTVPPNDSNASGAGLTWITQYNEWVKRQARLYRCPIVDYHSVLVNPSTNAYTAGYSSDGTHPTANGAKPMGDHLGDVLAAIPGPVRSPLAGSYNPNNMIPDVCANSAGSDKIVASGNTTGGWCFASVTSANWKGNAPLVVRGSAGNYQIAWPVTAGSMVAGHRCRLTFNIDVAGITIGSGTWSAYLYNDTQSQVVCGFNGATHPLNDGTSITATDAAVTSGSNLITCATSKPFRQAMVGNNVSVLSGVSTRFAAGTTIIGVGADGTTAYASANSAATASSQTMVVQGKPLSAVFEFDVQSDMVGDTFTFYMIAGAAAGTAIAVSQVTLVDLTALGAA